MPSGNTLPPELVSLCLSHLDPTDRATVQTLCSCSLVSSSFRALATANSLWKPIADAHYHQYRSPLPSRLEEFETDAFGYFASRARKDHRASEIVKEIQRPTDRIPLIEELRNNSALGCEVIENPQWTGGDHAFTEQNAPQDWLSLRYWAAECRKTLLRDEALRLWRDISIRSIAADDSDSDSDDEMTDLERGLDAFSAFRGLDSARLARERYDMSNHPRLLEATADPPLHFTGVRLLEWLATQVVDYIKSIGIGPAREGGFHSLDNHYVELVWRRAAAAPDGPQNEGTLPMTLVHIFCALVRRLPVARRFGIRAQMIGYPGTVLAGLSYRRRGGGGSGGGGGQEEDRARIYINVFGEGKILSPERLRAMLGAMGQADSEQDFLAPASARDMVRPPFSNNAAFCLCEADEMREGVPLDSVSASRATFSLRSAQGIGPLAFRSSMNSRSRRCTRSRTPSSSSRVRTRCSIGIAVRRTFPPPPPPLWGPTRSNMRNGSNPSSRANIRSTSRTSPSRSFPCYHRPIDKRGCGACAPRSVTRTPRPGNRKLSTPRSSGRSGTCFAIACLVIWPSRAGSTTAAKPASSVGVSRVSRERRF